MMLLLLLAAQQPSLGSIGLAHNKRALVSRDRRKHAEAIDNIAEIRRSSNMLRTSASILYVLICIRLQSLRLLASVCACLAAIFIRAHVRCTYSVYDTLYSMLAYIFPLRNGRPLLLLLLLQKKNTYTHAQPFSALPAIVRTNVRQTKRLCLLADALGKRELNRPPNPKTTCIIIIICPYMRTYFWMHTAAENGEVIGVRDRDDVGLLKFQRIMMEKYRVCVCWLAQTHLVDGSSVSFRSHRAAYSSQKNIRLFVYACVCVFFFFMSGVGAVISRCMNVCVCVFFSHFVR